MLSIRKLGSAAQADKYLLDTATDYYLKDDVQLMAEFHGEGLNGTSFNRDQFRELLEGKVGNEQLGRPDGSGGIQHVPGWDLTFSAPKSISIAALVGGDERLILAHQESVKVALNFLEKNGLFTRKTVDGDTNLTPAEKMYAALFTHTTSRALDPQLHTHSIILNMAEDQDGNLMSLESKQLFNLKMLAGKIYRNELASWSKELGYSTQITDEHHQFFELDSFSKNELKLFSKRRSQIENAIDERGLNSPSQIDMAAIMTRQSKTAHSAGDLYQSWQQEAIQAGFDVSDRVVVSDIITSGQSKNIADNNQSQSDQVTSDVRLAYRSLATNDAAFNTNNIIEKVFQISFGNHSVTEIKNVIETFSQSGELLPHPKGFTTPHAVQVESKIMNIALNMKNRYEPIMDREKAEGWVRKFNADRLRKGEFAFTDGQGQSAIEIFSNRDGVMNVDGWAGVGKTTMLDAVNDAIEGTGITVRGFAPTGSAAETLFKETGIESKTVDSFLYLNQNNPGHNARNELWFVDESSLSNAENTLALFQLAERSGARVVNLGDKKQLGSVEWGNVFSQLQALGIKTAQMHDILRQIPDHYKQAVIAAVTGNIADAFSHVKDSFVDSKSPIHSLINHYKQLSTDHRDKSLFVIPDNKSRTEFMQAVHEIRQEEGLVSQSEFSAKVLLNSNLNKVELEDARFYKKSQIIEFQADNQKLGITKGQLFVVKKIDKESNQLTLSEVDGNKTVSWSPSALKDQENSKFAVTVYNAADRPFSEGDKIKWTKSNKSLGLLNGDHGSISSIDHRTGMATIDILGKKSIAIDLKKFNTLDWSYADTAFGAQGKTFDYVYGVMESWRRNLVTQASFYVGLSRGKLGAKFFVDNTKKLAKQVESRTGENSQALHSQSILDSLRKTFDFGREQREEAAQHQAKSAITHSVQVLSETKGIFSHNELVSHALTYGFGDQKAFHLDQAINDALKTKSLSTLKVGKEKFNDRHYTTGSQIKLEASLASTAQAGLNARPKIAAASYVQAFIDAANAQSAQDGTTKPISPTEQHVLDTIFSGKDESVILNVDDKEHADKVLLFGNNIAKQKGFNVRRLAINNKSLEQVSDKFDSGSVYGVINKIQTALSENKKVSTYRKEVWCVDNAGLLNLETTKALIESARAVGSRLVFLNDSNEESFNSARSLDVMQSQGIKQLDLDNVHTETVQSRANQQLRQDHIAQAVDTIGNRIVEVDDDDKAQGHALRLTALANTYMAHPADERAALSVVIQDQFTRNQFTDLVREMRSEKGEIANSKQVATTTPKHLSPSQAVDSRYYDKSDIIRFDKDKDELKRDVMYKVTHVDDKTNMLTLHDGESEHKWSPEQSGFIRNHAQSIYKVSQAQFAINDRVRFNETLFNSQDKSYSYKNGTEGIVTKIDDKGITVQMSNGKSITLSTNGTVPLTHNYAISNYAAKFNASSKVIGLMDSNKPFSARKSSLINLLSNKNAQLSIITDNKNKAIENLKKQKETPTSALVAKAVKVVKNDKQAQSYGLALPAHQRVLDKIEQSIGKAIDNAKQIQSQNQNQAQNSQRQAQR